MLDIISNLFYFIIAITILIAFHEFGHFWVAKKLGIKVLRFSIGFGKPLYSRRFGADNIEFVLAAIPLGGYVKMLDERDSNVVASEVHRAFNRQHVFKRFAVVFAGPAFNFIFAIFAYWLVFVVSVTDLKPIIGEIVADSPADLAGLKKGFEIISVAGKDTPVISVAISSMLPALLDQSVINLRAKDKSGIISEYELNFNKINPDAALANYYRAVGILPWRPTGPPKVTGLVPDKPAIKAGFKVGDTIIKIGNQNIKGTRELINYISSRPEKLLDVVVKRNSVDINIKVTPARIIRDGKTYGQIGLKTSSGKYPDSMKVEYQYSALQAVPQAINKVWVNTKLMLNTFGKMLSGSVSINKISGPITIAKYAGMTASSGFSTFISFLAVVSISLGMINLFPIPILDGGHLFNYLIEMIKGSPVSENFEMVGQRVGILVLAMLMSIALYNDILGILR
ncbi:Intramembrane protease RasP/YluC, implicated in cell division based on FtsL cleavage [hydrothermal vent metagenome]|uniref:Intramembrane protease RasP/YluC, implicated in cell division based on FtsL cleavage n=1 Tax=hydrothermal vent metagenome TaxID=652676 RepID=A0A3B0ZVY4_9ZZZZ